MYNGLLKSQVLPWASWFLQTASVFLHTSQTFNIFFEQMNASWILWIDYMCSTLCFYFREVFLLEEMMYLF